MEALAPRRRTSACAWYTGVLLRAIRYEAVAAINAVSKMIHHRRRATSRYLSSVCA